jgi:hypothetical protein
LQYVAAQIVDVMVFVIVVACSCLFSVVGKHIWSSLMDGYGLSHDDRNTPHQRSASMYLIVWNYWSVLQRRTKTKHCLNYDATGSFIMENSTVLDLPTNKYVGLQSNTIRQWVETIDSRYNGSWNYLISRDSWTTGCRILTYIIFFFTLDLQNYSLPEGGGNTFLRNFSK